jgi:asparagine synthase (glutamine-hydrolysing)
LYTDETPFVESMAREYENLTVHFIRSHGFYVDHLDTFFEAAESPMLGAAHLPWVTTLQEEARRLNVRVLLNGALGNFTISYDGHRLLAELARQGRWGEGLRQARALAGAVSNASFLKLVISLGLMPLLPDRIWLFAKQLQNGTQGGRISRRFWSATSPVRAEFASSYGVEERYRRAGHCFRPHLGPSSRAAAILWRADRRGDARRAEESLYGIQNRDVPGDLRLLEFCLSIPEDQYLRNGTSRWLIRRAGAGRLPEVIRNNKMRGMQSPDWFQALDSAGPALHQEMDRLEDSTLATEILDVGRLRQLVDSIPAAGDSRSRTLDYRAVLEHGLAMGRFLQWIESGR